MGYPSIPIQTRQKIAATGNGGKRTQGRLHEGLRPYLDILPTIIAIPLTILLNIRQR